nr:Zn-dependent hydrolase [Bradyrhizobium sp. 143]
MKSVSSLKVDGRRLWATLMEMAEIGATAGGGSDRQALTDEDRQGRDLFRRHAEGAGCTVTIDEMGNMMALRAGRSPALSPVVVGSHLDTQPKGGRFDGVLGVLAGLEIVRTLNDAGISTERPLLVVNWTNEEGARFPPVMLSSGVWAGVFSRDWAYARQDAEGRCFASELARSGYMGDVPCRRQDWRCHLELHIEQGPVLDSERRQIGVVTAAQGIRCFDVTITGKASHAGTTPMHRRKDAFVAAAKVVVELEAIARAYGPNAVLTVGRIAVEPASRNVIPGLATFSIDLRHPEEHTLNQLENEIRRAVADACARDLLGSRIDVLSSLSPVAFDPTCLDVIRLATDRLGYSRLDVVSGAGHDSCHVAGHVPTAMVFIPCQDGLSHNEKESIEPEEAEAGCNVLLQAVLVLAAGEEFGSA